MAVPVACLLLFPLTLAGFAFILEKVFSVGFVGQEAFCL